jgi:filamin
MAQEPWVRIQVKTFTRWCNSYLTHRKLEIVDLAKDLADGYLLHNLLECLGAEKILPMSKPTTMKIKCVENLGVCLRYIKEKGIKLVAIGPEDIFAGNLKLILGLIWTLILRFQIAVDDDPTGSKAALLAWVNSVINPQGLHVADFKGSWSDGKAFCGLVNALEPGRIDLATCNDPISNMDRAFQDSEDLFKIPKILDAIDVVEHPDELSIMTYAAYFRAYMNMNTAHAPNCTAEGPGLTKAVAGEVGRFTVTCRSAENEEATRGGANVNAKLLDSKGNPVCAVLVKDLGTGKYDCEYVSPVDGDLELHVCVKKDHIKDSAFHPHVEPGEPSPAHCEASGPGISGASAGVPTEFTITAKDKNGKTIPKGGWNFTSVFKGKGGDVPVQIVDNGNGTYNASYTPKVAGDSELQVEVSTKANGSGPIKNAPFRFKVKPGAPDFSNFDIEVDVDENGNRNVVAGVPDKFTIYAKDACGNRLDTGGLAVTGQGSGTEDVPVKVVDNGDGSYGVEYTCFKTGPYKVELAANGNKLGGVNNPVKVVCSPAAADPSQSVAFGPGVEGAKIGRDNKFKVQARDAFGNDVKQGGAKVAGELVAPDGSSTPVLAKDNGDGSYDCSYPGVSKNGQSQLTPTLNGAPVKDAPFKINVESDDTDPSKTKVKLVPLGMEVELCDKHGNKREADKKDKVKCSTKKLSEDKARAIRNEDGTFSIKWPASFNGDYEAKVLVNGKEAPGGPWTANVSQPPLSAEHSAAVDAAYPKVAKSLKKILLGASPQERDRIIAAFQGGQAKSDSSSSSSDSD